MKRLLSVLLVLMFAAGVSSAAEEKKAKANEEVVASFEEEGDLDGFDFDGGVEATIEAKHATAGKSALKLVFPENCGSKFSGMLCADQKFTSVFPEDWSSYTELLIDVFNESETPVKLNWKFKSDAHTKQFTKDVSIPKGKPYTIKMQLKNIKNVNLSAMMYMKLFIGQDLPVATTLYFDNVRLIKKDGAAK